MIAQPTAKDRRATGRLRLRARIRRLSSVLTFAIGLMGSLAQADILWLKGDEGPIFGVVEQADDSSVRFQRYVGIGERERVQIAADEIELLIRTVDEERLQRLRPDDPTTYRDYGEELARYAVDPESRELAIRLFTIAGVLADQQGNVSVRESTLRNLLALARSEAERKRVASLARAYGIKTMSTTVESKISDATAVDQERWLAMVRSIRREQWQSSLDQLKSLAVDQMLTIEMDQTTSITVQDLESIIARRSITDADLDRLLRLELWLLGQMQWQIEAGAEDVPWSAMAHRPVTFEWIPGWDELNEFDPRLAVFRDGRWVAVEPVR